MTTWQQYFDDNQARFTDELLDFLRIPSISSLSEHMPDVWRAAEWVAARSAAAGMENVVIMETGAHPVVYADWLHAPGKPTIMIYGHYDVQPVDPLHLWESPPFEPVIKDERVYARGSNDDKGNMLLPILAAEALLQSEGKLPVNLKFFFEGQEEIGSPHLSPFIDKHKELLGCDMVISADGGQWAEDQPALMVGLRGLASVQIDVTGPDHDVHSGSLRRRDPESAPRAGRAARLYAWTRRQDSGRRLLRRRSRAKPRGSGKSCRHSLRRG